MIKIYAIDFIEFNLTTIKSHGLTINFLNSNNAKYMFIYEIFKKMHICKDVQFFILIMPNKRSHYNSKNTSNTLNNTRIVEGQDWYSWNSYNHIIMEKETLKVKAQVNENITFRMKGGRTMALTNGIQLKTNWKRSFRTIYSRIFILK